MAQTLNRRRDLSENLIEQTAGMIAIRSKLDRMIARNRRLTMLASRYEQERGAMDMPQSDVCPSDAAD